MQTSRVSKIWHRRVLVSKVAMDDGKAWRNGENEKMGFFMHTTTLGGDPRCGKGSELVVLRVLTKRGED